MANLDHWESVDEYGRIKSQEEVVQDRKQAGLCEVCGETRTHKRGGKTGIRKALTVPGEVTKGHCLKCFDVKRDESGKLEVKKKTQRALASVSTRQLGDAREARGISAESVRRPRGNSAESARRPRGNSAESERKPRGNSAESGRRPRGRSGESGRRLRDASVRENGASGKESRRPADSKSGRDRGASSRRISADSGDRRSSPGSRSTRRPPGNKDESQRRHRSTRTNNNRSPHSSSRAAPTSEDANGANLLGNKLDRKSRSMPMIADVDEERSSSARLSKTVSAVDFSSEPRETSATSLTNAPNINYTALVPPHDLDGIFELPETTEDDEEILDQIRHLSRKFDILLITNLVMRDVKNPLVCYDAFYIIRNCPVSLNEKIASASREVSSVVLKSMNSHHGFASLQIQECAIVWRMSLIGEDVRGSLVAGMSIQLAVRTITTWLKDGRKEGGDVIIWACGALSGLLRDLRSCMKFRKENGLNHVSTVLASNDYDDRVRFMTLRALYRYSLFIKELGDVTLTDLERMFEGIARVLHGDKSHLGVQMWGLRVLTNVLRGIKITVDTSQLTKTTIESMTTHETLKIFQYAALEFFSYLPVGPTMVSEACAAIISSMKRFSANDNDNENDHNDDPMICITGINALANIYRTGDDAGKATVVASGAIPIITRALARYCNESVQEPACAALKLIYKTKDKELAAAFKKTLSDAAAEILVRFKTEPEENSFICCLHACVLLTARYKADLTESMEMEAQAEMIEILVSSLRFWKDDDDAATIILSVLAIFAVNLTNKKVMMAHLEDIYDAMMTHLASPAVQIQGYYLLETLLSADSLETQKALESEYQFPYERVEMIKEVLATHSSEKEVILQVCASVFYLATYCPYGMNAIVESILTVYKDQADEKFIQMAAMGALWAVSAQDNDNNFCQEYRERLKSSLFEMPLGDLEPVQENILNAGMVDILLELIAKNRTDRGVLHLSFSILYNCFASIDDSPPESARAFVTILMDTMATNTLLRSKNLQQSVIKLLSLLCSYENMKYDIVGYPGSFDVMAKLMDAHSTSKDIIIPAIYILADLFNDKTVDTSSIMLKLNSRTIAEIIQAMKESDQIIHVNKCLTLLANSITLLTNDLVNLHELPKLIIGIIDKSPDNMVLQEKCLKILWGITLKDDANISLVISLDGIPATVGVMIKHPGSETIIQHGCAILTSLAMTEEGQKAISNGQAVVPYAIAIGMLCCMPNEDVLMEALQALFVMSTDATNRRLIQEFNKRNSLIYIAIARAMFIHLAVADIHVKAIELLINIEHDEKNDMIMEAHPEIIKSVVTGMEMHEMDDYLLNKACILIYIYTFNDKNVSLLCGMRSLEYTLVKANIDFPDYCGEDVIRIIKCFDEKKEQLASLLDE